MVAEGSVGGNPKAFTWKTSSSYQPEGFLNNRITFCYFHQHHILDVSQAVGSRSIHPSLWQRRTKPEMYGWKTGWATKQLLFFHPVTTLNRCAARPREEPSQHNKNAGEQEWFLPPCPRSVHQTAPFLETLQLKRITFSDKTESLPCPVDSVSEIFFHYTVFRITEEQRKKSTPQLNPWILSA